MVKTFYFFEQVILVCLNSHASTAEKILLTRTITAQSDFILEHKGNNFKNLLLDKLHGQMVCTFCKLSLPFGLEED